MGMTTSYSDHYYALKAVLKDAGITVIDYAQDILPPEVAGRAHYAEMLIEINEFTAKDALMTLAHEAGHLISYLRRRHIPGVRSKQLKESYAYMYGWAILRCCRIPISKEEWVEHHNMEEIKGVLVIH